MFFTFAAAIGGLAQLVRALAWHARGREFESRILHHFLRVIVVFSGGYFHFNGIRFYALGKPTVFPFRRPERRSTAADVRPRTPRDPRSFSANRSSAQPTYNCRPHPLHLRLRIETADNLQRGTESPRSESYPKHVRSHDLPRPLPTLRAPQTTPPPDRIPPGSTALPQTVRGRSATIPPPLSPHSRTVCFHPFPAPFLPRIQTRNESLPSLPKQVRSRRTGYFLSRRKPLRLAGVARRRLPHTLLQANRPMARDKAPSGLLFFPLPFRRNQPKIRVFRDPIPAYASGTAPKSVAPTAVDPKTSPPPARSAAELSTAVFGCPTLTRESDRPAAETTDFAGTAVIRAPDRPGPVAELARSIPATFRDRTEAYSHPSSPAPPEEPVPRAGHRTTHLRKTSAGTGPKTVHQSRFTRQPQSRPRKTARRTCSQSRTQPPPKKLPGTARRTDKTDPERIGRTRCERPNKMRSGKRECAKRNAQSKKEYPKKEGNSTKRKFPAGDLPAGNIRERRSRSVRRRWGEEGYPSFITSSMPISL